MSIDKSQWVKIADELQSLFCLIQFKYQDTVISINRGRVSESKTHLFVYIDSKLNIAGGDEQSEHYNPLTPLFWCSCSKPLYSKSRIADAEKMLGKRHVKKHMPYMYKKHTFLTPVFPNSTTLIRQYKKIEGLSLLESDSTAGGLHE
ncbi:hypothetical protein HZS38_09245 [Xenorhabdus nematophila]|uniref:Uncharacterized protein n=1 Tax=Xenorhabdus nematophila (strain ATCC 19061 / DSM 3370 / CCUG 14189 / LMG 1036 / NCIMB 9965 / AN6) TaxID=406817 RepID=D3V961_XENNA|nr:hypothetical protein [Xenorhabdus nematophila]CEF30121.1 hypothetical protein XNW1_2260012 [Xenorhabdus nematophila str. Websteri]AYA40569.1 hypothetical protein D3790_09115 [Xenorhabdus nematophila]MBA0019309.1 hypothetical protein [Xenorhabdus nematophila]MCB4425572.1 hypothetical protein [Xenorhabdus nematophila]QNJ38206.1 hypothetical protein H8F46_08960 [Xenorhabdus nematophila]